MCIDLRQPFPCDVVQRGRLLQREAEQDHMGVPVARRSNGIEILLHGYCIRIKQGHWMHYGFY